MKMLDANETKIKRANEGQQADEYLIEVYRQSCENARMYAQSRFSNLSAFVTFLGILTAALSVMFSLVQRNEGDIASHSQIAKQTAAMVTTSTVSMAARPTQLQQVQGNKEPESRGTIRIIGFGIAIFVCIVSLCFSIVDIRHHRYWKHYEGEQCIMMFEKLMGYQQKPLDADIKRRNWIKGFFRATFAVNFIYISAAALSGWIAWFFLQM